MRTGWRSWLGDVVVGGLVGGVIGAIVAVNVVIFTGIEGGYEASINEVFEQDKLIGCLTVAVLIAGPVLGAVVARSMRRKRARLAR